MPGEARDSLAGGALAAALDEASATIAALRACLKEPDGDERADSGAEHPLTGGVCTYLRCISAGRPGRSIATSWPRLSARPWCGGA